MGLRFLNCCEEPDYGVEIFEDKTTFELLGISAAAVYHITCCDLNADFLVEDRRQRAKVWNLLLAQAVTITKPEALLPELKMLLELAEKMIPLIPSPPLGYVRAPNTFRLRPCG